MDKWNEIVALAHSNWLHFLGTHYVGEGRLIHMQCRRRRCSQSQLLFALFDGICSHLLMLFYENQCWWYCHLSDLPVLKSAHALTVLPQGCIYFVYTYTTSCWNYCSLLNLWLKTHASCRNLFRWGSMEWWVTGHDKGAGMVSESFGTTGSVMLFLSLQ